MVSGSQFVSLKSLVSWEEILHLKSISVVQYTHDHLRTWEAEAKGSRFEARMGRRVRTYLHKQQTVTAKAQCSPGPTALVTWEHFGVF